jgi:hypothetical protein
MNLIENLPKPNKNLYFMVEKLSKYDQTLIKFIKAKWHVQNHSTSLFNYSFI